MRIQQERVIALIIDLQERIFPAIHQHEQLLSRLLVLINGLKALGVPLLVTEQYVKGLGPTLGPVAEALGPVERMEKSSFSCCDEPGVMLKLAASGKEVVIVAGIESHVCVLQTVIDLKHNGYLPVVVTDCISSRRESDKAMALERMRFEGALLTTNEAILFELLRYSGTETFKSISKLVK